VTGERKDVGRTDDSAGAEGSPTDDVAGAAQALGVDAPGVDAPGVDAGDWANEAAVDDPDAAADPPPAVAELAAACVRFVTTRYGTMLDFRPETLSLLDQWLCDARAELKARPEAVDLVQSAAGAYLGEVVRRTFGGRWFAEGDHADWRLYLSMVYCAFNPIGMAREALLLDTADGWHAHFDLDPGEREGVEARLAALPPVDEREYFAPSTRFDVVSIVVEALRASMRARGLADVRFTPDDYRSAIRTEDP
jgi:hypothetical protein